MNHHPFSAIALFVASAIALFACCSSKPCPNEPGPNGTGGGQASPCAAKTLLSGGDPTSCSAVQINCAAVPDIEETIKKPSFAGQADFDREWKARVEVWIKLLRRIKVTDASDAAKTSAIRAANLLEAVLNDEANRKSLIEGNAMPSALWDLHVALEKPDCKPK